MLSGNSAQTAQDNYFKMAIQPQLNGAAIQQYLGGNLGDANSTAGSTYLGSLAAQGADQSFFSGQQYFNNEVNNLLNERSNLFGTDIATQQQQNQLGVNASLGADQLNQNALQGLNNFNLGGAGLFNSIGQNQMNAGIANNANKAAALGGLVGGGMGLLGGVGNSLFGPALGSLGSTIGNKFSNFMGGSAPGSRQSQSSLGFRF